MKIGYSVNNNNPSFTDEEIQALDDLMMYVLYENDLNTYRNSMYCVDDIESVFREIHRKIKPSMIFDIE